MSNNDQVVLETIIKQSKQEQFPDIQISDNDFFNWFVSEQLMKDFELSYDEINEGIVDNGGDGGIDAIYTFVNEELIQRDSELIDGKRNTIIDVFIIQSKNTNGFSETSIDKINSSSNELFDLNTPIDGLHSVYNNDLLANIEVFRNQFLHLASKFPILRFHFFYVTKGDEVHPNVERKVSRLKDTIKKHFDSAEINFEFITAKKLIELSRKERLRSKELTLTDNPISTQDGGYIALVPIMNFFKFITDENGNLIRYFFDANIRDYQGNVDINKEIRSTLNETTPKEDFWWLNNGITITAGNATLASKRLLIEDPQIVNGLQTSFEINKYFTENKIENDYRNILVRIIKVDNEISRLKIIKATNSQTNIPPASLRATDPIHRNIEDYLYPKGFYYDRRKNYHKNQGKPINKIIGISYLSQIITSIYSQKADYARARPSTLIKKNIDYENIFNDNLPLELYYKGIIIQKEIEKAMINFNNPKLTRAIIGDIKFHVALFVTCLLTNKIKPTADDIAKIDVSNLEDKLINTAIEDVYIIYDTMGGTNAVAKGTEFVTETLEQIQNRLK
jgi:hypothetical protein